jgi:hypothetical protein
VIRSLAVQVNHLWARDDGPPMPTGGQRRSVGQHAAEQAQGPAPQEAYAQDERENEWQLFFAGGCPPQIVS